MQTREIPLTPGAFAWAVSVRSSRLQSFPHRTLVKIIENDLDKPTLTVCDRDGKTAEVQRINLLPRLQYLRAYDKTWLSERSECASASIHFEIRRLWEQLQDLKELIDEMYWRLRRSGDAYLIDALEHQLAEDDPIQPFRSRIEDPTPLEKEIERLQRIVNSSCPYRKLGRSRSNWIEAREEAGVRLRKISQPGYIYEEPNRDEIPSICLPPYPH